MATTKAQSKFTDDEGEEWDSVNVPKPVKEAVEEYAKARKAAGRAALKKKEAKNRARELMDKHEVDKVPYTDENGNKGWIYRFDNPDLKSRRVVEPKKPKAGAEE